MRGVGLGVGLGSLFGDLECIKNFVRSGGHYKNDVVTALACKYPLLLQFPAPAADSGCGPSESRWFWLYPRFRENFVKIVQFKGLADSIGASF